jgi:CheY-like chemotaxis protein
VDDAPAIRETTALLVSLWGYDVCQACDGPSALAKAAAFRPDVALLDIGMPGMTGWDLAERLRAVSELRRMVLIAITGFSTQKDRDCSFEAGFRDHLVKPVDPEVLEHLLVGLATEANGRESRDPETWTGA